MPFARPAALVFAFLAACGSTAETPTSDAGTADGGGGGGGGDAGADAATGADAAVDGGAIECEPAASVGKPCVPGQLSCDHVDECCSDTFVCDATSRAWKSSGVACLQCEGFTCGDKKCTGGQVCLARSSGVSGGATTYECAAMPDACSRQWTCDCVTKNVGSGCTLAGSGSCTSSGTHVTLSCMGI